MTNDATRASTKAVFTTVPYPSHQPVDEIDEVFALLRAVRAALMAGSQRLIECDLSDAEVLVGRALDQLDPILTYLAESNFRNEQLPFVECRRVWFALKGDAS